MNKGIILPVLTITTILLAFFCGEVVSSSSSSSSSKLLFHKDVVRKVENNILKEEVHDSLLRKAIPIDEYNKNLINNGFKPIVTDNNNNNNNNNNMPEFMKRKLNDDNRDDDIYNMEGDDENDENNNYPYYVNDQYLQNFNGYSLKYAKCQPIQRFSEDAIENGEYSSMVLDDVVILRLCPKRSCTSSVQYGCFYNYGEYVIDMIDYVTIMIKYQQDKNKNLCNFCLTCDNGGYFDNYNWNVDDDDANNDNNGDDDNDDNNRRRRKNRQLRRKLDDADNNEEQGNDQEEDEQQQQQGDDQEEEQQQQDEEDQQEDNEQEDQQQEENEGNDEEEQQQEDNGNNDQDEADDQGNNNNDNNNANNNNNNNYDEDCEKYVDMCYNYENWCDNGDDDNEDGNNNNNNGYLSLNEYVNYLQCVQVQGVNSYEGSNMYIKPRCEATTNTIHMALFYDPYCSQYGGDESSPNDFTGIKFSSDLFSKIYDSSCYDCSSNSVVAPYYTSNMYMCNKIHRSAGKCTSGLPYNQFNDYNDHSIECAFINSIESGTYDNKGRIYSKYSKNNANIKEEITIAQKVMLVISLLLCFGLGFYSCYLHHSITNLLIKSLSHSHLLPPSSHRSRNNHSSTTTSSSRFGNSNNNNDNNSQHSGSKYSNGSGTRGSKTSSKKLSKVGAVNTN